LQNIKVYFFISDSNKHERYHLKIRGF